jgi:hypothetical protein
MTIDLFKKGIEMLKDISCPDNEITMWTFYMAMAINRLSYIFIDIHKEDLDSVAEEMFHLTNQAIHLFLSVIHDLESQCNIYVLYITSRSARAFRCFG